MISQNIRIRDYCSQDFNHLWLLDQQCFAPGIAYSRFELMHYIRAEGAFTLVAEAVAPASDEVGPLPLGFLVAECGRRVRRRLAGDERQARAHIITIDVSLAARRRGVGSLLMDAAEARLTAAGCKVAYLETAVNNHAAIDFYLRRDYRVLGTLPRYYDGSLDALVMGKKLAGPTAGAPQRP